MQRFDFDVCINITIIKHRTVFCCDTRHSIKLHKLWWRLCYNTYCPLPSKPSTMSFELAQSTSTAKAIRYYKKTRVQYMYRWRSQVFYYTFDRRPVHLKIVILFLSRHSVRRRFRFKKSWPRQLLPYVIGRCGAQTGNALYRVLLQLHRVCPRRESRVCNLPVSHREDHFIYFISAIV